MRKLISIAYEASKRHIMDLEMAGNEKISESRLTSAFG